MTGSSKLRSLAVAVGALSVVAACGPSTGGSSETLAADQTFRDAITAVRRDAHRYPAPIVP